MIFSTNRRILILLFILLFSTNLFGRTTHYYRLVRKVQNGISVTDVSGGQYITFIGNICYESDKKGIGVGHGSLTLDNNANSREFLVYYGESFWGSTTTFKFKSDKSVLNVIPNDVDIYVYRLDTPPASQLTSSLIRSTKSNNTSPNTNRGIASTNEQRNISVNYKNKLVDIKEDNSHWKSYYTSMYKQYEGLVTQHSAALKTLLASYNGNGTSTYAVVEEKRKLKEAQKNMKRIRYEAQEKGIHISVSYLESVDY